MEMEKKKKKEKKLVLWMLLLLLLIIIIIIGVGEAVEEAPNNKFSESATPNPHNSYWEEVRNLVNKGYTYLFPPKIDFRPGKGVEDGGESGNGNVKEAITKSFEKTKEMVEDSAKAAAEKLQQHSSNSEL